MTYLAVRNWRRYQHYRDRTPVWIKAHVEMLHDEKLRKLPISTRLLWHQMLFLAATFQNAVPNDPELIGKLSGIDPEECREGVALLVKGRWLREKQTRRSASKPASVEKKEIEDKEEIQADSMRETPSSLKLVATCPECFIGGGNHVATCSRRSVA